MWVSSRFPHNKSLEQTLVRHLSGSEREETHLGLSMEEHQVK